VLWFSKAIGAVSTEPPLCLLAIAQTSKASFVQPIGTARWATKKAHFITETMFWLACLRVARNFDPVTSECLEDIGNYLSAISLVLTGRSMWLYKEF
jgi:hypothetical protein